MNLLQMLDALELKVVQLRAKNDELTEALHAEQNGTIALPQPKKVKKGVRKPKKGLKVKAKQPTPPDKQEPTPKKERVLGKRQALGRSLTQLRRPGAAPEQNPANSEVSSEDLITRG